jgi:hypothetical protein
MKQYEAFVLVIFTMSISLFAHHSPAFRNVSRCPVNRIHHSSVLRPSVDGSVTEGEKGTKRRRDEEAKRRRERGGERDEETKGRKGEEAKGERG